MSRRSAKLGILSLLSTTVSPVSAVTYYPIPGVNIPGAPAPAISTVDPSFYSNLSAYNDIRLTPPGAPGDAPRQFNIQLQPGANTPGLSIPQRGNFIGFSFELSVADQLLGKNSSLINVPLLNYLNNLRTRAGQGARVRVGGNSQEDSTIHEHDASFDQLGVLIKKSPNLNTRIPTVTPLIDYSDELLYTMSNISTLVDTHWYFGLAFSNPSNFTNAISASLAASRILGDRLIALQLSNEPDLYGIDSRRRQNPYGLDNLLGELDTSIKQIEAQPDWKQKSMFLGPSTCCNVDGNWDINDILGRYIQGMGERLKIVAVQHYPTNNCQKGRTDPNNIFGDFLTHQSAQNLVRPYAQAALQSSQAGKEFVMFETNTASCGGFSGLSDSFGAALWGIDYGLQMAYFNFTNALWHFGGQNTAYNPFTPPPGKTRKYNQWTTGSLYYSTLVITEALGASNKSQVIDLGANGQINEHTPAYAIYEDGQPTRVVFVNFLNDPSGQHDLTINLQLPAGTNVGSVTARYLLSPGKSVADKANFTWAGQSLGDRFKADGRLYGDIVNTPIPCDAAAASCQVKVPASSAAIVFLSQSALDLSSPTPEEAASSFPVSFRTKLYNTISVPQEVLKVSNGRGGKDEGNGRLGSTSRQIFLDSGARSVSASATAWLGVALGVVSAWVARVL